MNFLKNIDTSSKGIFKYIAIAFVALFIVSIGIRIARISVGTVWNSSQGIHGFRNSKMHSNDMAYEGIEDSSLSMRNVLSVPPDVDGEYIAGENSEEFEITEYHAHIETSHLQNACDSIDILKPRNDVIFERSTISDKNCHYTF